MPSAQDISINLLPPSEFESSFWGKFLKWAVTTGRYVIIVTELVVIVAFLMRFKLDNELVGLTDEIRGKKNVLDAQAATEIKFLDVQASLTAAGTIMNSSLAAGDEIDMITKTIPAGVKLGDLTIRKEKDLIVANAAGSGDLGIMLGQMSKKGVWKSVDVSELSADALTGIKLSIDLKR